MNCINLREQFGRDYRITFDDAYDPKGRHRDKLDPWMMQISCQRGVIYPYGGELLAVEVERRAPTRNRLRKLDCATVIQDGDDFLAVTFDVANFRRVARIVKPRRTRRMSDAMKEQKRRQMVDLNARNASPGRFQPPVSPSDALA